MRKIDKFIFVGTRRWARVVLSEIFKSEYFSIPILILCDKRECKIKSWLEENFNNKSWEVVFEIPKCNSNEFGIGFVLNSAYLHYSTISKLLKKGYHVVSEKPVGISTAQLLRVIELSEQMKKKLFCTNTFLFASYLSDISLNFKGFGRRKIIFEWYDKSHEMRYGELKAYDSSVPLIIDVLPHIVNILFSLTGDHKLFRKNMVVSKGGMKVLIKCNTESMDEVVISLSRNSSSRKRLVSIQLGDDVYKIDFSNEPANLFINGINQNCYDSNFSFFERPISSMLKCLSIFCNTGVIDNRLGLKTCISTNMLVDNLLHEYVIMQNEFIMKCKNINSASRSFECNYAIKEAKSFRERALKYVDSDSPLNKLINRQ